MNCLNLITTNAHSCVQSEVYNLFNIVEIMSSFSAVCWLFGKRLFDKYQRPIGLIQAAWGGTRIETWSSPDALKVCFDNEVPP